MSLGGRRWDELQTLVSEAKTTPSWCQVITEGILVRYFQSNPNLDGRYLSSRSENR